ncbi:hypothetical protein ANO11243_082870 [Dothideomycetidae sp. 11243]|nr:hypothetical protein ANO11243_082870 [fungal sp. No.11243]
MAHHAEALKTKDQYTQAILRYSKNPLIFTNRAFARLKLQRWEGVVDDCLHSIEITGHDQNFKAYFYLAQAQLALHHPHEALSSALTAYDQAMYPQSPNAATPASSMSTIVALVIKCRKAKFEARQRETQKRRGDLLGELEDALDSKKRADLTEIETLLEKEHIGPVAADEARSELIDHVDKKKDDLRNVFAIADPENHAKREVPEWAIDSISFELMHDPVITKNGHSYERQTIVEHLKRSPTDPLTRDPLTIDDLRPNIALRKALDEFWRDAETWAVEW